ncbi:alpha/beta fold hydrolase [Sinomonas sp. B1-1]|uniref:alpha/beta fold hydrolase n=1 Tax=Sinomonas sp. B1-1 TaxID=3141454 RepID=UPI003D292EF1
MSSARTPFVLLHGWACPPANWDAVARLLTAAGHRVVTPHLLGYGAGSAGRDEDAWTLEAAADDVVRLLERLGSPAVVAGHSLGGSVAATLAARRPDLVRGLAFVGMVPVAPSAATAERLTRLFLGPAAPAGPDAAAIDSVLAAWYGAAPADPVLRAELEAPFRVRSDVLRGSLRAALGGVAPEVPEKIEAPVAVVLGAGDQTRPAGPIEALLAAHPGWTLTSVPDAGHMVHVEAPRQCADALLALAASAPTTPPAPVVPGHPRQPEAPTRE